jgi:hypothetical protein
VFRRDRRSTRNRLGSPRPVVGRAPGGLLAHSPVRVKNQDHCNELSHSAEPAGKNVCTHTGSQKAESTLLGVDINNKPLFSLNIAKNRRKLANTQIGSRLHRTRRSCQEPRMCYRLWGRYFPVTGTAGNLPSHTRAGSSRSTFSVEVSGESFRSRCLSFRYGSKMETQSSVYGPRYFRLCRGMSRVLALVRSDLRR